MNMYQSPFSAGQESATKLLKQLDLQALEMAPWLKSLAFFLMFTGAVMALSIIALPVAWLPVAMGIVLYQAGNRAASLEEKGDSLPLLHLMSRLKTYLILAFFTLALGLMMVLVGVWYLSGLSSSESAALVNGVVAWVTSLWP